MAKRKAQKKTKRKKKIDHEPIVGLFSKRLREIRMNRGLKQRELASMTGINVSYVTRLERGVSAPGIDLVERLAQALEVAIHDLLPTPQSRDPGELLHGQARSRFESILKRADTGALAILVPWLAMFDNDLSRRRK